MKVTFEDKKIKIRKKEGIILIVDSTVHPDLIDVVEAQIRQFDVEFKLGGLSLKDELAREDINGLKQKTINRGRFIAPLIEGFSQALPDKEYDLIILHSGRIYDLEDFKEELSSKFGKMVIKNINEINNWIDFLKREVFDFSIDYIFLSFLSPVVPYEWDSDLYFSLSLDTTTSRFILKHTQEERNIKRTRERQKETISRNHTQEEKAKKGDINLKIQGKSEETDIEVDVNGLKFKGRLKNDKTFILPQWRLFPQDDIGIFRKHLKEYKNNNFNIECPLCSKTHLFKKPFFCKEQSGDVLTGIFSEGRMILKSLSYVQTGFILLKDEGSSVEYLSSERDILEFEEMRFVFVLRNEGRIYRVECKDTSLDIKEAVKLYGNLYELEENSLYILV